MELSEVNDLESLESTDLLQFLQELLKNLKDRKSAALHFVMERPKYNENAYKLLVEDGKIDRFGNVRGEAFWRGNFPFLINYKPSTITDSKGPAIDDIDYSDKYGYVEISVKGVIDGMDHRNENKKGLYRFYAIENRLYWRPLGLVMVKLNFQFKPIFVIKNKVIP